jgi:hypothetical protein
MCPMRPMRPMPIRWLARSDRLTVGAMSDPAPSASAGSSRGIATLRRAMVVPSVLLLLAACGGGDGEDAATTTTRPETTTTTAPRTPEEAFLAGLEDGDATFDEGRGPDDALAAAREVCDSLDLAARASGLSDDLETTPDAEDLDESIGRIGSSYAIVAEVEMDQIRTDFGDRTGELVLALMAEHLCPQHFGR